MPYLNFNSKRNLFNSQMAQTDHIPNRKIIDWVGPRFHNESCLSFSTVPQSYISQVLDTQGLIKQDIGVHGDF